MARPADQPYGKAHCSMWQGNRDTGDVWMTNGWRIGYTHISYTGCFIVDSIMSFLHEHSRGLSFRHDFLQNVFSSHTSYNRMSRTRRRPIESFFHLSFYFDFASNLETTNFDALLVYGGLGSACQRAALSFTY